MDPPALAVTVRKRRFAMEAPCSDRNNPMLDVNEESLSRKSSIAWPLPSKDPRNGWSPPEIHVDVPQPPPKPALSEVPPRLRSASSRKNLPEVLTAERI